MDFGLVGWWSSNLIMDLVLGRKWSNENKVERFRFISKGITSYMDFYMQNVGHDSCFFKSTYHTNIIMIYVEFLQKYFNKWNLHLTNICWEKKIGISKTDFNDVRPSITISWVLQLVNKMTIVFFKTTIVTTSSC